MSLHRVAFTQILVWSCLLLVGGCASEPSQPQPVALSPVVAGPTDRVLVVRNVGSTMGKQISDYYVAKRGIPPTNVVEIDVSPAEEIGLAGYQMHIEAPVRRALESAALKDKIDFIVLAKGTPIRIKEGGYSVDAFLGAMDLKFAPIADTKVESFQRSQNPYFAKREAFSRKKYGFYLVTRLDGYSVEDAKRLVDNSLAAKPNKGLFLLDLDPKRKGGGYDEVNRSMRNAAAILKARGFDVYLDETETFMGRKSGLAGYYSWGSNDYAFDSQGYKSMQFLPGAICETAVSTSGRTFWPTSGGQSLIADLIAAGVTGVKGYVSEPYTIGLCPADILFDRYTDGYNLAESFYMATPLLKWKDVVIGDPLCAPYAKK
ncbi:MAG: TIGR03790 family protein [Fimbriimonadia bacterium]